MLARINALEAELAEARQWQIATSDILRTIVAGNADGTLRKIAETTLRLFGAIGASFRIAEGDEFKLSVSVGAGAEQVGAALWDDASKRPKVAGRNLPGTVVRENRQIHLPDLDHLDPDIADWPGPPVARSAGIRTMIGTPLRTGGGAIGALTVYRDLLRPFERFEQHLLQSFADQAAIAIENARLITETREALEQQTATAEVLGVINASPGDLAPVFDAILEKAMRLCGDAFGELYIGDGERLNAAALRGIPEALAAFRIGNPTTTSQGTITGRINNGEDVVHVLDLMAEDAYQTGNPQRRALVDLGGARTALAVALRNDRVLLGLIMIYRQEMRGYTEQQIALLQNFATQAVIAMENARLITETREALEQQTATAEVLGVINSSPGDLAPVFDAMLEKATRLCQASFGYLQIYDGDRFRTATTLGVPPAFAEYRRNNPPQYGPGTTMARVLAGERVVTVPDLMDEEPYRTGEPNRRALVDLGGARSLLSVALRKDDSLLGAFNIYRQDVRPFSDKEIKLVETFAAQAVIAIENARLLGELRQRTEEIAALNRGLEARVAEQVDELGRVGRLKRFLAPQLAELIVSQGDEKILESHRREIVVVFCDLRGYTAFTETAEPEEVLDFLREYHGALGPLVSQFEGTLDQFSGDGIMVFFNDPVPIPDPAERAVKMAVAMRESAGAAQLPRSP